MRRRFILIAAVSVAACGEGTRPDAATRFAEPLGGVRNQHFFYLNYVDEQPGSGIRDYTCGIKTYEGHAGTDITLANFAVMDSGVAVLAAAGGTVVAAHDGEFDRQKSWTASAVPNYVVIRHPDGLESIYLHLKKNSVAVSVGQQVRQSDVLGHVGSSGFSDIPHLHFEVRAADGTLVDPWVGECGAAASRWSQQLSYQNAFSFYGSGLTNAAMTLDLAKDPPPDRTLFTTNDPQVSMWVELINVPAGAEQEFRIYRSDGTLFFRSSFATPRFYGLSWWWFWHTIPGYLTPGAWRMEYRNGGVLLAAREFVVVDGGSPVLPLPSMQSALAGTAGGSAGADWAWWPEQSSKLPGALAEPR